MNDKNHEKTRKIVLSALFAAFIAIGTLASFPLPGKGYANLGDCFIIVSALLLDPKYAFFAAGIGSALSDVILGYSVFAPGTFIIKGLMALALYFITAHNRKDKIVYIIIAAIASEVIMIAGYFVYGSVLFGFAGALEDFIGNIVQGLVGGTLGVVVYEVFDKTGIANLISKGK